MHITKNHIKIWKRLKLTQQRHRNDFRKFTGFQSTKDFCSLDTFHRAVRPCLFLAHFFGLMPLVNSLGDNPYHVKFKLPCLTCVTTLLFFIFGGFKVVHFTGKMFRLGINPKNMISVVFLYICLATCLYFLNLARNWPEIMKRWTHIDMLFFMPPYQPPKRPLHKQLRTLTVIFWLTALAKSLLIFFMCRAVIMIGFYVFLVETCMYHASAYYNFRMKRLHCYPNETHHTFKDFLIMDHLNDVFTYFPYHLIVVIWGLFLNFSFTFMWNFMDFFIMSVSLGLATRFQQFAARIQLLTGCYVPDALWNQIRRHHIILCEFMETINDHLSTVVLMSTLNNMYFICNQLLNIFTKLRYPINYVYFWFSLIFLLMRTACVFMFASAIHDAALLPMKTLYLVPSGCWTEEVQRFMAQILNETIGLTGKNFFLVTRKSLFGMMATIITYEFMLLQFDAKSRAMGLPDICA